MDDGDPIDFYRGFISVPPHTTSGEWYPRHGDRGFRRRRIVIFPIAVIVAVAVIAVVPVHIVCVGDG